jgi:thioredoxin-related protein
LYNLATALLVLSGCLLIFLKLDPKGYNSFLANLMGPDKIQWLSFEDACSRAGQIKRPLLLVAYDLTKDNAQSAEAELFRDREMSDYVNNNFLPVRVDTSKVIDNSSRLGRLVNSNAGTRGHFYMLSVPWNMTDMNFSDVVSSHNPLELGVEDLDSYEGYDYYNDYELTYRGPRWARGPINRNFHPALADFDNKDELRQFLSRAKDWHAGVPTRGRVQFAAQSKVNEKLAPGAKPRLLFFVQNVGAQDDAFRGVAFWNKHNSRFINENFEPILFDIRREKEVNKNNDVFGALSSGDFLELRRKLGVQSLPSMVVQFSDGRPDAVIVGSRDVSNIERSLKNVLVPAVGVTDKNLSVTSGVYPGSPPRYQRF